MQNDLTDEELIEQYKMAYRQAYWYDGNNPGRQAALDKVCSRLAVELRARGLKPVDYHKEAIQSINSPS
jgi:hypothetical protein